MLNSKTHLSLDAIRAALANEGLFVSKLLLAATCSDFLSTLRFLRYQGILSERPQFSGPKSAELSRCPPGFKLHCFFPSLI